MWSVLGRAMPYKARRAAALGLSRRLLEPHRLHRIPGGYVFGIDSNDAFQALMVAGLYDRHLTRIACRYARAGSR